MAASILVLGGTVFVGNHVAAEAVARGLDVTVFTRGRSGPAPAGCRHLVGDRDGDLDELRGRTFDAVIDTSGYVPRVVADSSEMLRDAVGHYVFVSTASVYANPQPGGDETEAVLPLSDASSEDVESHYGALKAACERVVTTAFGADRVAVVRPGLIVGPRDPSGRFTWWVLRAQRPGTMLAPGDPTRPVQLVDGRDLAAFLVQLAVDGVNGVYDAVGPAEPLTMGELVAACCAAAGDVATPVWVDDAHLLAQGASAWMELPLWLPAGHNALLERSGARAHAAGLRHRPVPETVADTAAWAASVGAAAVPSSVGIDPEKEAALVEGWETWIRG